MINKIIKSNIVIFIVMFFLFSFASGEFDMLNWPESTRVGFSIVEGIVFFISFMFWADDDDD